MIKEAIEYIVKNFEPTIIKEKGKVFCDKQLIEVDAKRKIPKLNLSTLTSLIDYIKSNKDRLDYNNLILVIENHNGVSLRTAIDADNERENIVSCIARTKVFNFDRFLDKEKFIIGLQSQFCDSEERNNLLKILATVQEEAGVINEDNGITQSVKTKKGIVLGENTTIPNPIKLAPYRTFVEINQPTSQFVFRISNSYDGLEMALFEADGGVWEIESMQRIKMYLTEHLKEEIEKGLTILA